MRKTVRLEMWQTYGISSKKNTEVEVLSGVELFQESIVPRIGIFLNIFFVGDAT